MLPEWRVKPAPLFWNISFSHPKQTDNTCHQNEPFSLSTAAGIPVVDTREKIR
jgi:hypothetical protein